MNEGFPSNFDPKENTHEESEGTESIVETYEALLASARALKEQGVDPFEYEDYTESPNLAVVDLWDRIQNWEGSHDLVMRYITTVEKAMLAVQAAFLWIDAGFADKGTIKEALDRLVAEEQDARENPESNDEIREILSNAVEKLEQMLAEGKPDKKIPALIEQVIVEANEKIEEGDLIDTVRLLTSTLLTSRFQKFFKKNPDKKEEITRLRDAIRERWQAERFQGERGQNSQ